MKIIAKTENGFLLDAKEYEIASIQAMSQVDKRFLTPKPGDNIEIWNIYNKISEIPYLDEHLKNLNYALQSFSNVIKQFEILRKLKSECPKELDYQTE